MADSIRALLIEPSLESRTRMKEALWELEFLKNTLVVRSLEEAEGLLRGTKPIGLIFLSQRLDGAASIQFIEKAKRAVISRDAASVLVQPFGSAEPIDIAAQLANGFDGFLLEPYSLDQLIQIIAIADKVREKRQDARMRTAMRIFVAEILAQVDQVSEFKRRGRAGSVSQAVFREMAAVLPELDSAELRLYFELLIEESQKAVPSANKNVFSRTYQGVSERVRKKFSSSALVRFREAVGSYSGPH